MPPRRRPSERLPTGSAPPDEPNLPWWRYRRPPTARSATRTGASEGRVGAGEAGPDHHHDHGHEARPVPLDPDSTSSSNATPSARTGILPSDPGGPSGVGRWIVVALVAAAVVANGMWIEEAALSRVLVPVLGLAVVVAALPALTRRHPDESWLPTVLLLGVVVKIIGSVVRYRNLIQPDGSVGGDASLYHLAAIDVMEGRRQLPDRTGSNFIRWFTAQLYEIVGVDLITAFLVYGLLAFLGAYLWYRATADAVPFVDKRLYAILIFFLPSIVFWPASLGKEALMQLGVGLMVLGLSQMLRGRVLRGLLIAAPGAWLVGTVRPHLLALVVIAGGLSYVVGRRSVRSSGSLSLMRPIGILALVVIGLFVVNLAADFLGMEELSISAIEAELDEQTERSAQGGSEFETGGASLSPLSLPKGAVTVLLRPFPWEVQSPTQILASLEVTAITLLILLRLPSIIASLQYFRRAAFLTFCWAYVAMYSLAFASFANFGLLVRQRSLVLPALFVLLCVDPLLARRRSGDDPDGDGTSPDHADISRPSGDGRRFVQTPRRRLRHN